MRLALPLPGIAAAAAALLLTLLTPPSAAMRRSLTAQRAASQLFAQPPASPPPLSPLFYVNWARSVVDDMVEAFLRPHTDYAQALWAKHPECSGSEAGISCTCPASMPVEMLALVKNRIRQEAIQATDRRGGSVSRLKRRPGRSGVLHIESLTGAWIDLAFPVHD